MRNAAKDEVKRTKDVIREAAEVFDAQKSPKSDSDMQLVPFVDFISIFTMLSLLIFLVSYSFSILCKMKCMIIKIYVALKVLIESYFSIYYYRY